MELCNHKDIYIDGNIIIPMKLWTCDKCGADNPVWRIDCADCGSPRWKYIDIDLH